MLVGLTMFPTDYSIPPHDLAVAAEARGYESLWLPEAQSHSHQSHNRQWPGGPELPKYYYDSYDPFVSLAAAAAVSENRRACDGDRVLSSSVIQSTPPRRYRPVDQLSSGRFAIFGVGEGWNEEEMASHGTAFATRFKLIA